MGDNEEGTTVKLEKSSSAAMDHKSIHVYPPDWAAMQAYYGPHFAVPPFMNSASPPAHPHPPYMWGPPQSMIPHGNPYAAFYAHGGVYAHPGIPMAGTPLSMETPVKSSGNTDGSFIKKLKEFNGLAMSIGNGSVNSGERGTDRRPTESNEETEDSSGGSNGVTTGALKSGKKRSRSGSPNSDGKAEKMSSLIPAVQISHGSKKKCTDKMMENVDTALVLKDPTTCDLDVKSSSPTPSIIMPNEGWLQNERELKRERRKQSNRESARRSRLRKQAEAEELATKVEILTSESLTLKSERKKLIESSEKLRLQNANLKEKLEEARLGQRTGAVINLNKIDDYLSLVKPVGTVNLLARVNNNSSDEDRDTTTTYEVMNQSSSGGGAKLHQLLDAKPIITDAVAAS